MKNGDYLASSTDLKASSSNQSNASLPFIRKLMNPDGHREEGLIKIMELSAHHLNGGLKGEITQLKRLVPIAIGINGLSWVILMQTVIISKFLTK